MDGVLILAYLINKEMDGMTNRALETIKSMLNRRGIQGEYKDVEIDIVQETPYRGYEYAGVLIVFSYKGRTLEPDLVKILNFANENNYTSGIILVISNKPSDSVLNAVRSYVSKKDNPLLLLFEVRHLMIDISQHRKVPKHEIINEDEINKMTKEFHIHDINTLPKIDSQDPMARWIGARPGDVIRVTGLCETSGENRRYRLCVTNATEI